MSKGKSSIIAFVIAIIMVSSLLMIPGCGKKEAGLQIEKLETTIEADPERELLDVTTSLRIKRDATIKKYSFDFLEPTEIARICDKQSGRDLPFEMSEDPQGRQTADILTIDLDECDEECVVELTYRYDAESFTGLDLNPATGGYLILGEITKGSIYSSHLNYYPYINGSAKQAEIQIITPAGWVGASSGDLTTRKDIEGGKTLYKYEIPFSSGRLPYPLAIYPYELNEAVYEERLPVTIYSAEEDIPYAKEKLKLVTDTILPFLEDLMGEFPFDNLRIVEVFPSEGMTGLAAKSLVMLSQDTLFAAPIGDNYDQLPSTVLVDEIAHQWNFYKVMFPNYLAEGISEYTDNLFLERYVDEDILGEKMTEYRQGCESIASFLNELKKIKESGATMEEAAEQLDLSTEEIQSFWQFADYGEVPITDPNVYLALYFMKGAVAIDALRNKLGDEVFFKAFKRLFLEPSEQEVTLDYFRESFEAEYGESLDSFFDKWYFETGIPTD